MEKTRLEIQGHGVMLSDYFCGTRGVMLSISIDNKTTVKQVIEAIESEINELWDHITYTAEYHGFSDDLDEAINAEIEKIKEFNANRLNEICDPALDFDFNELDLDYSEFQEYPVLILTIEFLED